MFSIKNKTILTIGQHPDDIEIGCFGTLTRLAVIMEMINILNSQNNGEEQP